MIYTVTLNPAIDYIMNIESFNMGEVNRSSSEEVNYGGKGINVSAILTNLNIPNIALGFISGFTGNEIKNGIEKIGVKTDFISLNNGFSRINVKLKSNKESEINGMGPKISENNFNELLSKLSVIKEDDFLVLAGSIPLSMPDDTYEKIMEKLKDKNIKIVVDATKDLLLNVLKYKPFLIKPNKSELAEIFKVNIESEEEVINYAKKLQEMGARNVLISMASEGSILITNDNKIIKMGVYKGVINNSVGAGDSMVGGFIAGYIKNNDYLEALKLGTACGGATAFSNTIATRSEIEDLINSNNMKGVIL